MASNDDGIMTMDDDDGMDANNDNGTTQRPLDGSLITCSSIIEQAMSAGYNILGRGYGNIELGLEQNENAPTVTIFPGVIA